MTNAPTPPPRSRQIYRRAWTRLKALQKLYLLVLPTTLIIALLGYYPKIDVIVKSMFRWNGSDVEEYIGLRNFQDAFADPLFWSSFQLVFILLVANVVKLWPGIFAAVSLHRISNDRLRYIFQVCFVVPMVIPGMVWLLIWKSFYDPSFGILNRALNASGLMGVLHAMDGTADAPGLMPRVAGFLQPILESGIDPVTGSVWGFALLGAFLLMLASHGPVQTARLRAAGLLIATAFIPVVAAAGGGGSLWFAGLAAFIVLMVLLARCLGPRWVVWMFLFFGGLYAFRENYAYFPAVVAGALLVSEAVRAVMERFSAESAIRALGGILLAAGIVLILLTTTWTEPTGQFQYGTPAWLGNQNLVIPALLFWGFPWINTVGVLIYLAGLQQIPIDVYEAAEIDGIGPVGMLFRIELPLILTQVRINLIFMTIGTLTTYEMFLILLGPDGGPGNKGMVPGLYMFSKAFLEGKFGYACALGMVLFFMILGLTVIYNKYVKVEK